MVSFIYLFCIWYHHHKVLFFFFFSGIHSCTVLVLTAKSFYVLWVRDLILYRNISQAQQKIWTELLLFNLCFVFKVQIINSKIILKHFCNSFDVGKILIPFNLLFCIPILCGIYPTLILNRNAIFFKSFSKLVVKLILEFMNSSLKKIMLLNIIFESQLKIWYMRLCPKKVQNNLAMLKSG